MGRPKNPNNTQYDPNNPKVPAEVVNAKMEKAGFFTNRDQIDMPNPVYEQSKNADELKEQRKAVQEEQKKKFQEALRQNLTSNATRSTTNEESPSSASKNISPQEKLKNFLEEQEPSSSSDSKSDFKATGSTTNEESPSSASKNISPQEKLKNFLEEQEPSSSDSKSNLKATRSTTNEKSSSSASQNISPQEKLKNFLEQQDNDQIEIEDHRSSSQKNSTPTTTPFDDVRDNNINLQNELPEGKTIKEYLKYFLYSLSTGDRPDPQTWMKNVNRNNPKSKWHEALNNRGFQDDPFQYNPPNGYPYAFPYNNNSKINSAGLGQKNSRSNNNLEQYWNYPYPEVNSRQGENRIGDNYYLDVFLDSLQNQQTSKDGKEIKISKTKEDSKNQKTGVFRQLLDFIKKGKNSLTDNDAQITQEHTGNNIKTEENSKSDPRTDLSLVGRNFEEYLQDLEKKKQNNPNFEEEYKKSWSDFDKNLKKGNNKNKKSNYVKQLLDPSKMTTQAKSPLYDPSEMATLAKSPLYDPSEMATLAKSPLYDPSEMATLANSRLYRPSKSKR